MLFLLLCLPSVLALPQGDPQQLQPQLQPSSESHDLDLPLYNASGTLFSLSQQSACRTPGRLLQEDNQTGRILSEPANPFGDSTFPDAIFVQSISIGTPPRNIKLQMDTGSWQFWTYETDCTSGNGQDSIPNFYDPATSSTSNQIDDSSWSAGYGNGAFRKNLSAIYMDRVVFGTIDVPKQAIGRPQQPCSTAKDQVTQGLVGLGYGQWPNAHPPQNTFFTNLAPTLRLPLFTVSLNYRKPGFYDFGFIDKQKYSGNIRYFNVPKDLPTPNLWGVTITGLALGPLAVRTPAIPAFIDSGGAFIFLPEEHCNTYYRHAPNARVANIDVNNNGRPTSVHIYPCKDTLPDLAVFIGDQPEQYVVTIPGKLLQGAETGNTGDCVSNLMVSGSGPGIPRDAALLGLPFLRTTFAVFRYDTISGPRVGLARKPIDSSYARFGTGVNAFANAFPNDNCI